MTGLGQSERSERSERGAALPTVAILLVALLGMAALAVDLGWFYLTSARLQRAADAAALAGVANLPLSPSGADVDAAIAADINGFGDAAMSTTILPDNHYQVTLSTSIDTFFASVVGVDSLAVSRTGTAQNLPPLALGNRNNQFGNSCKPGVTPGCSGQDNFWANIHGKYTDTQMGDARSAYCNNGAGSGSASCAQNPNYRSSGYLYGIERGDVSSFTVSFLDIEFHNGDDTGDGHRTGDRGCESGAWGDGDPDCGQTITARLYAPDPTPLDLSDNGSPLCEQTWNPVPTVAETDPYTYSDFCFVSGAQPGIYVLQVVVNDPTDASDSGLNRYSLRVLPSTARVYGLGDFSIYNNVAGVTSFDLAEVPDYYKGKTFVVELYDPGESSDTGTLTVVPPSGANISGCRIYHRNNNPASDWVQSGTGCSESVSPSEYNGRWLKFEVDLAPDYSCTVCWFRMTYNYAGTISDTTTWTAYMLGDPLRLVPNS